MFNINLTSDIFKNPQKICNFGGHFSSKEPCVDKCQIHILDTNFPLTSVKSKASDFTSFLPSGPLHTAKVCNSLYGNFEKRL